MNLGGKIVKGTKQDSAGLTGFSSVHREVRERS